MLIRYGDINSKRYSAVSDLILYKDETLIQVISPVGSTAGHFAWPTSQLSALAAINKSSSGYYLCWNEENDPNKPVTSHQEWPRLASTPRAT